MNAEEKARVDEIRYMLKNSVSPCYDNTSKTEVYCRCPFCGDSKNKSSAHFYIEMKPPFRYNCKKCNASGRLNSKVLDAMRVYNNELVLNVMSFEKQTDSEIPENKKFSMQKLTISDEPSQRTEEGLKYFNSRYDSDIDLELLNNKFKCTCDIPEFLKKNGLTVQTGGFDISHAIGFLSADNSHIICRSTDPNSTRRYSNINLTGGDDDSASKVYNMRAGIDILEPKINLVITEGIFDIIGIYLAKYMGTPEEENTIFAAACGKSFMTVINKFIHKGFLDMDVTIYSDADVDISFYQEMKNYNYIFKDRSATETGIGLKVFYNTLSKDCGVPKKDIQLREASLN